MSEIDRLTAKLYRTLTPAQREIWLELSEALLDERRDIIIPVGREFTAVLDNSDGRIERVRVRRGGQHDPRVWIGFAVRTTREAKRAGWWVRSVELDGPR